MCQAFASFLEQGQPVPESVCHFPSTLSPAGCSSQCGCGWEQSSGLLSEAWLLALPSISSELGSAFQLPKPLSCVNSCPFPQSPRVRWIRKAGSAHGSYR